MPGEHIDLESVRRVYRAGEVVVQEGEEDHSLLLIAGGTASVKIKRAGRERYRRLATFSPGTVFGEVALLDRQPRSATVTADENLVCYVLSAEAFDALTMDDPPIAIHLLSNLGYVSSAAGCGAPRPWCRSSKTDRAGRVSAVAAAGARAVRRATSKSQPWGESTAPSSAPGPAGGRGSVIPSLVLVSSAVIPFLLVWLRSAGLAGQAVALGGALFALVVLGRGREPGATRAVDRTLRLTTLGALVAGVAQIGVLAALEWKLADDAGWPIVDLLSSTVGLAGVTRIGVACLAAAAALVLRRAPNSDGRGRLLLVATLLLTCTGALASHAIGRLEGRVWLWSVTALHQAAAGTWLGGLVCAAVLGARPQGDHPERWLRRFSALAAAAVVVLASTGMTLSIAYLDAPDTLFTTSYGAMVLTKIVLFIALLAMGVLNHRAVHGRIRLLPRPARVAVSGASTLALRRRLEVEAGLGLVALALAASLGSAPPATGVTTGRATLEEVRRIFTPQWPRWQAPSTAELAAASDLGDPRAPRVPENTRWSEFGHHVAGVFVVGMGLLAMLERTGQMPWARHWPLLIVGLTGFITWSMDPEGWQTGTVGFWEQLLDPEVLQHRLMLLLTAAFALAEWRVRSGRHPTSRLRFVFPLAGILGGVLLLAHVHEVSNPKTGFFMELTHLPLGLVALLVGWTRWLELRVAPAAEGWSGRLWAPALVVFGLLLILYREA